MPQHQDLQGPITSATTPTTNSNYLTNWLQNLDDGDADADGEDEEDEQPTIQEEETGGSTRTRSSAESDLTMGTVSSGVRLFGKTTR